jgi:hypothetical protein
MIKVQCWGLIVNNQLSQKQVVNCLEFSLSAIIVEEYFEIEGIFELQILLPNSTWGASKVMVEVENTLYDGDPKTRLKIVEPSEKYTELVMWWL